MYTLEAIRSSLARQISQKLEAQVDPSEIVIPPKPGMGDLSFGCFRLAREKGLKPDELAKDLASALGRPDMTIEKAEAAGPYLNFTLRGEELISRVVKDIENHGERYGALDLGQKRQVMLEFANANTHKEFHVGHLRNILLGLSVERIMDLEGWKTIPVSYLNDLGSHVAKCLWLFIRQNAKSIPRPKPKARGKQPSSPAMDEETWVAYVMDNLTAAWVRKMIGALPTEQRTGSYLGQLYVEAHKLLEENETWKSEVSLVLGKLETHDPAWTLLWQETRRWSYQEFTRLLQHFNVRIERQYFESDFIDQSKEVVNELMEKGLAIESQGAVIVDLDAYPDPEIQKQKLGVFMIRKSDGTLIYAAKDIPLAELKFMEYPDQVLSVIIVDSRQGLYFRQLFATLKLMGYTKPFKHLGYEFVTLPEGAMASRKGNVILLKDFMDMVDQSARKEIMARHQDWNEGKIDHTAWCLALGGMNFAFLKQDPEKVIVFDMQKALSFDGDTGPYVQYAATRLQAIIRKAKAAKVSFAKADMTVLKNGQEKALIMRLAQLPEYCAKASENFRPSVIAQWLLETAGEINAFYRDVKVLDAPEDVKKARLRLIAAARQALSVGLWCLGVPVPDEM